MDARGHVVGVAVATLRNFQNANYAITLEEICGFASGRLEREEEMLRLLAEKRKRKRAEAVREADNGGNAADDYRKA